MQRTSSKLAIIGAVLASILGITILTTGQPAQSKHHAGLVEDWSSHHLIFSNRGAYEKVKNDPAAYSRWLSIQYSTRYIMQQARRRAEAVSWPAFPGSAPDALKLLENPPVLGDMDSKRAQPFPRNPLKPPKPVRKTLKKDWSEEFLTGAVLPNTFPAKYSFNTTGTPDCANDFVVYPTGSLGSSSAATIITFNNL